MLVLLGSLMWLPVLILHYFLICENLIDISLIFMVKIIGKIYISNFASLSLSLLLRNVIQNWVPYVQFK